MLESRRIALADHIARSGMGVMLATIWIHLGTDASKINDRLAVHFYSVAFLAFSMFACIVLCRRRLTRSYRSKCLSLESPDVSASLFGSILFG
jgi:hypothetical protein